MPKNNSRQRKAERKQKRARLDIEINESRLSVVEREHERGFHKNCTHGADPELEGTVWDDPYHNPSPR